MRFAAGFILGAFTAAYAIFVWLTATPERPDAVPDEWLADPGKTENSTRTVTYTYSTS